MSNACFPQFCHWKYYSLFTENLTSPYPITDFHGHGLSLSKQTTISFPKIQFQSSHSQTTVLDVSRKYSPVYPLCYILPSLTFKTHGSPNSSRIFTPGSPSFLCLNLMNNHYGNRCLHLTLLPYIPLFLLLAWWIYSPG